MGRWGVGIMAGSNLWASEPPGRGSKINLPTPWPAPIQKVWSGSWESVFHRSFLWGLRSSAGETQLESGAPSGTARVPRTQSASSFPVLTLGFPPPEPLPTSLGAFQKSSHEHKPRCCGKELVMNQQDTHFTFLALS